MYDYFYQQQNIEDRRQPKYALVMFLPEELDRIIAPLREKYDPLYNLIASHITVVFPFESGHTLEDLVSIVKGETEGEQEFLMELSSILDFYPEYPVICWQAKACERLTSLYYRLYSRLGIPLPHKHYKPHVTVAREISDHRVLLVKEKVVPFLPDESFKAHTLDLITPLAGHKWVSVRSFPLVKPDD